MKKNSSLPKYNSKTDWTRVDAMTPTQIDLSDNPEMTPELFATGVLKRGGLVVARPKELISLRVDADVLEWFKSRGKGYQSEMNALLKAYKEVHTS